mmetsp:Transcript_30717/g.71959  ORF Transcript_30717/g.71959 Transcript_30717/m.71959 type:complete len:250 (-) Transcript_30717:374-1123(-)
MSFSSWRVYAVLSSIRLSWRCLSRSKPDDLSLRLAIASSTFECARLLAARLVCSWAPDFSLPTISALIWASVSSRSAMVFLRFDWFWLSSLLLACRTSSSSFSLKSSSSCDCMSSCRCRMHSLASSMLDISSASFSCRDSMVSFCSSKSDASESSLALRMACSSRRCRVAFCSTNSSCSRSSMMPVTSSSPVRSRDSMSVWCLSSKSLCCPVISFWSRTSFSVLSLKSEASPSISSAVCSSLLLISRSH